LSQLNIDEIRMRISEMNWMQVEEYLRGDDRAVLPIGSIEQHGYLSLAVDAILAERVAVEAAESAGVPVFPVLSYGVTPYFLEYPGSVSLKVSTHLAVVSDILDSLAHSGFKRILIVNGHGGNGAVQQFAQEWLIGRRDCRLVFHNWWNAPLTGARVREIDPVASHASWMENFPWTRLANVDMPQRAKDMLDVAHIRAGDSTAVRDYIGDGNFGGAYQRPDEDMLAIWRVAVDETRALIDAL
jgi:creatinine amidohydrolase